MKRLLIMMIVAGIALTAAARRFTVSGYITNGASSETLISATVYDSISGKGCMTNEYGFYSLSLPEGRVTLRYSYVGFATKYIAMELTRDTAVNVRLQNNLTLDEVVVKGQRTQMGVEGSQMSAIELPINFIQSLPTFAGEVDVIKALQLMPGVQTGNEGTSGLYIRGGGADENLILLDGVPLYNVSHMLGIFSTFNADAIKNVTFYKGNFPARYGGRLSGVVDVRQKDGDAHKFHGSATIGTMTAKVNLEGPIWKEHTTFNISARRTFIDALIPTLLGRGGTRNDIGEKTSLGYSFWDVNARISHRFSDRDRLTASFYMGDDRYYDNYRWRADDSDDFHRRRQSISWGNILGAINWNHVFSPVLFSDATVSYTRYSYKTKNYDHESRSLIDSAKTIKTEAVYREDYLSNIDDIAARYSLHYTPDARHNVRFGVAYTYHGFTPTAEHFHSENKQFEGDVDEDIINKYHPVHDSLAGTRNINAHEVMLYAEDDWTIHRKFKLNYGLRGSMYHVNARAYWNIEPRVSLRWLIIDDLSFKASYAYTTQQIHALTTQNESLPIDIYVPSTAELPAMTSHQEAAGLYYNLLGLIDFSVEGYYKTMDNVIDFRDGSNFTSTAVSDLAENICIGRGWAYGVEFMAQRTVGKITGMVAYTWSKAFRKFDRTGQEINFGHTMFAPNDRRHDFTITINYRPIQLVDFGATFVYATGSMTTLATQHLPDLSPWVTERYNYRMPDYHRLDLNCNLHFKRPKNRHGEHLLSVSIYNVYNQANPMYMVTRDDGTGHLSLYKVSLFPIIPSLSYSFRF